MKDLYQTAAVVVFVWALAFALIQLAHAYWREQDFRVRYVIGTAILCAALTVAGLLLDDVLLMIVPWVLASAGATILVNYHYEAKRRDRDRAAHRSGELVGGMRKLSQDVIDRGGYGSDTPERQN